MCQVPMMAGNLHKPKTEGKMTRTSMSQGYVVMVMIGRMSDENDDEEENN